MSQIILPGGASAPLISVPLAYDPMAKVKLALNHWYYGIDFQAVRICMYAAQAFYLPLRDMAWIMVCGPASTGKTAVTITGAAKLPKVRALDKVTEHSFLSGFYGHKNPGLLEKLGSQEIDNENNIITTYGDAIFLWQDFTTVLSLSLDARRAIFGQLRTMYDGKAEANTGTGVTKRWSGKACIIAAVTPAIEDDAMAFRVMGERFMVVRWPRMGVEAGLKAIEQAGHEAIMEAELQMAMSGVYQQAVIKIPKFADSMTVRIAHLAELTAMARTPVHINNQNQIFTQPYPEGCTRLVKGYVALCAGGAAIYHCDEVPENVFTDIIRVAWDSMPPDRACILQSLLKGLDYTLIPLEDYVRDREMLALKKLGLVDDVPKLTTKAMDLVNVVGRDSLLNYRDQL